MVIVKTVYYIIFFLNPGVSEAFASLADMEYAEAFGVFLVSGLLLYWLYRNYRNYAGNPYMLKFGLKDETIVSISKKIKVAEKVVDFILTAAWIITGITYIGDTIFKFDYLGGIAGGRSRTMGNCSNFVDRS